MQFHGEALRDLVHPAIIDENHDRDSNLGSCRWKHAQMRVRLKKEDDKDIDSILMCLIPFDTLFTITRALSGGVTSFLMLLLERSWIYEFPRGSKASTISQPSRYQRLGNAISQSTWLFYRYLTIFDDLIRRQATIRCQASLRRRQYCRRRGGRSPRALFFFNFAPVLPGSCRPLLQ